MTTGRSAELVVVGSINQDISVPVAHLPAPGETVLGGDALWTGGGKGANQALAAARLGRGVAMVGAVGDDAAGHELVAALAADGVDVGAVSVRSDAPSGVALIAVAASGENSIVVSPGANGRLGGEVSDAVNAFAPRAVLVQLEIPDVAVAAAVATGRAAGALVVLNPAPARGIPAEVLAAVDVLVPNRGELAALAGASEAVDVAALVDQARALGLERVVVTLGADGALVIDSGEVVAIPVVPAEVVDTTGAGDSFCAALVDGLLDELTLVDAVRWATRVAAVTVSRRGAQVSLPTRAEVG